MTSRFQRLIDSISVFALLTALIPWAVNAQITAQDLSTAVKIKALQHPYLFFTDQDKPALLKRIQTEKECKTIMAGLLAEGRRYLSVPIMGSVPPSPKHPRFSAAVDEASAYTTEIREGAVTLAFLYQMTGETKYAKKAIEFAMALSDLDEWVNPAHKFDIIYPRVWPRGVPDDRVVFSYDIVAAGTSIALATVYDWVYPVLTKPERDKIRNGLLEKAITRVRGNYDFFWWSSAHRCNWSAICYSGLGISAMSLLKENPQVLDVVAEAYNGINLTLDQIGEDGGWQEGRGYYSYMMWVSIRYMDALKRISGGAYNMFDHPRIKNHPFDFMLYGTTANFEDSEAASVGPTNMINKLTAETGSTTGAWYREKFLDEGSTPFDILWPRASVKPVEPDQKSKLFKSINWAILRSDFLDPASFTIACKAGYNDDPHHGHLDCGQFTLTWYGVPFIRDLGRIRYDELYFNEERWAYPQASSEGHNLVFVNGEQQMPAKLKDQPWKDGIGGEILDFRTSAKRDYVLMDPTHAYPGKELKKWRRNIVLEKPTVAVVVDEVSAHPGSTIAVRFFPGVTPPASRAARQGRETSREGTQYRIGANYVILSAQRHSLALIPLVLDNSCAIREDKLADLPVTEDARLNWIPYLEMVTTAKSNTSIVVTLFVPVNDEKEIEAIVRTASVVQSNDNHIEVGVETPAGKYKWSFEKEKDGLVLKD